MKRLLSLFLLTLLGAANATTYLDLSLEQILAKTELGFLGEVVSVDTETRDGEPWTLVTFEVGDALIGTEDVIDDSERISLAFLGGSLPSGEALAVSLMPSFSVGETVLVLAYKRTLYSPIVGFRQGLWRSTTLGLRDEDGELLGVNEEGNLTQGAEGAPTETVLEALRSALEEQP